MKKLLLLLCLLWCSYGYGQTCRDIEKRINKTTGVVTYVGLASGSMLQISNPKVIPIIVMGKLINKADTSYIMSLGVSAGSQPAAGAKGIIMLFSDGSRIERPNQEVKVQSTANGISVSAEPLFSAAEFNQMTTKTLTNVLIINNEGTIQSRLANAVNTLATCLLNTW